MTEATDNPIVQSDLDPMSPTSPLNPANWDTLTPTLDEATPVGV